jgi:hypothetical protein
MTEKNERARDHYLSLAKEAAENAANATDPRVREAFDKIAQAWLQMAAEAARFKE